MKKTIILMAAILGLQANAQSWNLTGNAGTNPSSNFIGTTDNQPLIFKINGSEKMKLSPNGRLVFFDVHSQTWAYNLYIGGGNEVPSNNAGGTNYANVAVGLGSMSSNTTGSSNTALGYNTMTKSTTGSLNTALGINSMQNSVSASSNVAVGVNTLGGMIAGEFNTAIGHGAMRSWGSTASVPLVGNTAIGTSALMDINNGSFNTILGNNSFMRTVNASYNVVIGTNNAPLVNNATGNIYIGNNIAAVGTSPSNELNIGNWIVGNNGTIGIGQYTTQLPADGVAADGQKYKLFVKDGIRTEKVKVDIAANNGWADYVFAKDYQLMPLNDLAKFIDKNGHLPEVPTTDEAIKNGIELKEMNILLLKKIEELTLYTLEQQKRIEALEKKVK
ncbi:hypothetical protein C1631_012405 [Chryseobacterium phosphatilyticum]|uniref:Peptidase S74 domain-containing protein n=1 Tax=Chryseobacterium phosphatilyticum TaxID=475075 RepID=A0A316X5E5_9FLAO|nr:hypothetical protein [Chryseobacterium phosphatilyticum]PWN68877.1 hypothetical protein C1631_012405 [Chryseobacterium phosphatilyticum]